MSNCKPVEERSCSFYKTMMYLTTIVFELCFYRMTLFLSHFMMLHRVKSLLKLNQATKFTITLEGK
jgi:hypothetical protein